MTITPEDIDEICNRVVANTMRKTLTAKQATFDYEWALTFATLQQKLIDNLVFNFKAKLEILPGQKNAPNSDD